MLTPPLIWRDSEHDQSSDQSITSGSGNEGSRTPHHHGFNRFEGPSHLQLRCISPDAKTLASSVSFTEVLVVPSTAPFLVQPRPSRETCISPDFPLRKSDQFVLVAMVPLGRDVVPQISHVGSVGHVGEPRSFRGKHAALHDIVSDDFCWSYECIFPWASGRGIDARGLSATRLRYHVRHEYE